MSEQSKKEALIRRADDILMIVAVVEATISLAALQADGFAKIQIAALLMDKACLGANRTHAQGIESLVKQMSHLGKGRANREGAAQALTDALIASMKEEQ